MTFDQEPDSFAGALHEAAYRFDPPHHEHFHERAVQRARVVRRRRATAVGLAGGLAIVGVAGALAVIVPGGGNSQGAAAGPGVTTPAATSPRATASQTHRPTGTASSGALVAATVTQAEITQAFLGTMPASVVVLNNAIPQEGNAPLAARALVNSETGDWYIDVNASVQRSATSTGLSSVSLVAQREQQIKTCAEAEAGSTTDTCTVTQLDGGTLILDETRHNVADPSSDPIWQYTWLSPSGYEVDFDIGAASVSDFALSTQQVVKVLTDPVWGSMTAALPAPACVGGTLSPVMPTGSATNPDLVPVLKCSTTGQMYPLSG